ncbi:hypothetical protein NHX12_016152, partial [Muraenolepis orangiensis]
YWRHREDVLRHLEQWLQDRRRGSEPASGASRDKARSAAATATRAKQAKTPQPTPRTRTAALPRISTPGTKTSSKASVPKTPGAALHKFSDPSGCSSRAQPLDPAPPHGSRPRRGVPPRLRGHRNQRRPVTSVVTAADSEDDDWSSDISELQEMDPKRLQAYQQPNAIAADKRLPAKPKQAKTPQPTPRTRTAALPRISTPGTKTSSKASVPKYGER